MTHYKRVLLYSKNIHTLARRCFCHHFFFVFIFVIHMALALLSLSGLFLQPGVLISSFPFSLAHHSPSLGRLLDAVRVGSSDRREGITVLNGIAGSAKLMAPGSLKGETHMI